MATFYLLPPRPVLEDSLSRLLDSWLPGLSRPADVEADLAEFLRARLSCRGDVFLVFREELPEGAASEAALCDGFGAEAGDDVIEMRLAGGGRLDARRWRLGVVSAG